MTRNRREGYRNPDYEAGARWLEEFMRQHNLNKQHVTLILGENPARVHERLNQEKPLTPNIRHRLERWVSDGCPTFPYWHDSGDSA
jgi:plasmid maintenance system antidote protein VapI